ncbi:MAG: DedA family protein [Phycisphaerales bacterium]
MLEQLIQNYGYLALFLGAFLEGETVLVLAGFAAHRGYLDIRLVILVAFLGSLAGDQTWFFIGRFRGMPFVERRPAWKARAAKILDLLHRYHAPLLIGFRFLYGLRNPIPFVVGASGFSPWRFLVYNAIGAFVWATVVGFAGFVFGEAMQLFLADVRRYERWGLAFLALVGLVSWLIFMRRRRAIAAAQVAADRAAAERAAEAKAATGDVAETAAPRPIAARPVVAERTVADPTIPPAA